MHRFSRMHLSAEAALRTLDAIDLEEKSKIAESIALIAVIDERRDYLAAGYSCMRNYCVGRLRMSVDKAGKRIQVARAALLHPEIFECLADGRLSITTAATIAPHLTAKDSAALLASVAFKSKDEIVQMLSTRLPAAAAHAASDLLANVQNSSGSHALAHVSQATDPEMATACGAQAPESAPERVSQTWLGRVSSSPTGGYDVRLSITEGDHEVFRRAQALLSHVVPSGNPAEIYSRAMAHFLAHLEKQRFGTKPGAAPAREPRGRGIPRSLRRLVWERDGRRCTFVSADGHRCGETHRLQIDHIVPVSLGGKTVAENLRLLCRAHNQYEAERILGKEHVQARRELSQRARARDKAAAKASAARAKAQSPARTAATQERHDDLLGALRGLGFKHDEARRGAAMADTMPDATLDTCLRHALAELTRPVALRGERLARSTA